MDLLGDMPTINCSFEEAFHFYKAIGRGDEFKRAVCEHIKSTNAAIMAGIMGYCNRRLGEWAKDDVEKEAMFRRRAKKEEERLAKWGG